MDATIGGVAAVALFRLLSTLDGVPLTRDSMYSMRLHRFSTFWAELPRRSDRVGAFGAPPPIAEIIFTDGPGTLFLLGFTTW
jgi:hypothetical protein